MGFNLLEGNYNLDTHRFVLADESMVLHCHHYNAFLQRSIQDAEYIDSKPFLIGASAEAAFDQLSALFKKNIDLDRSKVASEIFRQAGFGTLDFSQLDKNGGTLKSNSSHYAVAWKAKFTSSNEAVNHFASGYLVGSFAAIYNHDLKSVSVVQSACMATGAKEDIFIVSLTASNFSIFEKRKAVKIQKVPEDTWSPNHLPVSVITKTVAAMPLLGDINGLLPVFGVYLTRMYADYYNRISFEFERQLTELVGENGPMVSSSLFIEAGHVCAFNTFGGIMTSVEWDSLIKSELKSKEDWVYAMVACVSSLGWGTWTVRDVSEKSASFEIFNDYESIGYQRMYGKSDHPISYLALGAAAGIMDLVYLGDVIDKPEFTEEFYTKLFKSDSTFEFEFESNLACGDPSTKIRVFRK
ncbi:MAG: hypothetical protein COB02_06785 [Candidatus Cloacimonadota bacterium]|nr:MAG: hypothetical protein COB02_06785 [Candidatus Cloacimonadota bacterium]